MTIAKRLTVLIVTSIACLLLLSVADHFQMNRVFKAANYGNENAVPSIQKLDRVISSFLQIRIRTLNHILASYAPTYNVNLKPDIEKTIKEAMSDTENALKDYGTTVGTVLG